MGAATRVLPPTSGLLLRPSNGTYSINVVHVRALARVFARLCYVYLVRSRYILKFPHRVPFGLPAAGTFARTGGDPRENATGVATFLWGDDQFMGLTLLSRLASGQELDNATREKYADLAGQMQIGTAMSLARVVVQPLSFELTASWLQIFMCVLGAVAFSEQMRDASDGLYSHGVNVPTPAQYTWQKHTKIGVDLLYLFCVHGAGSDWTPFVLQVGTCERLGHAQSC